MTKELTQVKWILEGKLYGYGNAKKWLKEKMNISEGETREICKEMYEESRIKEETMRDVLETIKRMVKEWE